MKIKMLLAALLLTVTTAASAQSAQSGQPSKATSSSVVQKYNRVFASYSPLTFSYKGKSGDDSFGGFQAGWLGGFNVMHGTPLYLEVGANVQANFYSDDYVDETLVSLNIPVNVTYRYTFNNTKITLAPYAGLRLKGNIIATDNDGKDTESLFDKDYMGDNTAKRLQVGYQIGVGITLTKVYLGIGYEGELSDFTKKVKGSGFLATIGLDF